MQWSVSSIPCSPYSVSFYPVKFITQGSPLPGLFPNTDRALPHRVREYRHSVVRGFQKVLLVCTPTRGGGRGEHACATPCVRLVPEKASDTREGKRRKARVSVSVGFRILRKCGAGAGESPTQMSRRRNLETGRNGLVRGERGHGQPGLSVSSASQGQVVLKETRAASLSPSLDTPLPPA